MTLHLDIPDSLHKKLQELTIQEGYSISQFAASAIAEKLTSLMTVDYLQQRARNGDRVKFEKSMAKVPDSSPAEEDVIS